MMIRIIGFWSLFPALISCGPGDELKEPAPMDSTNVPVEVAAIDFEIKRTLTEKSVYLPGEIVLLRNVELVNNSDEEVTIDSAWIEVGKASNNGNQIEFFKTIGYDLVIEGDASEMLSEITIDTEDLGNSSYLVHIGVQLSSSDPLKILDQQKLAYVSFFRITMDERDLSYYIETESFNGLPVYKLHGGLSAEYAVQKSASNLKRGIAHSWTEINPPRQSAPDFLQRSIDETMKFYEQEFGSFTPIKRVIISTGITPVSYISRVMDAPVLPLHYLVGTSTIKEIQAILDQANADGLPAYATYGHDYSLSTTQGVAWIKLLDLPSEYRQFIIDHGVEEVIYFGATSPGGGEKAARQYQNGVGHREPGSIYLMYFSGEQAEGYLRQVIKDFSTNALGSLVNIADWESGIIQKQVDNMSTSIVEGGIGASQVLVTAPGDDIHLWNMASYAMLKFFQKNGITPSGISLNPYLAGHPFYESYFGIVPFTYFNHGAFLLSAHTDRIEGMLANAFARYYPGTELTSMKVYANTGTRSDFFNYFQTEGYTDVINVPSSDAWDLGDGNDTPSEVRARELLNDANAQDLKTWGDGLTYLSIQDLREIANDFSQITVTDQ